ncbi:MAG: histidine phosphatase family protein [Chitinophagales bacterium]|nr:histidine phosphatase family protein [Bacteroidota bacterium]
MPSNYILLMTNTPYKTIFLIRHGQTDYNKKGMIQGSGIDSSLNRLGQRQAEAFYQYYQNVPFEHIFISKLQRTYQSVQSFIEKSSLPFTATPLLNEIHWGNQEGKRPSPKMKRTYEDMVQVWAKGDTHYKVAEGESPEEVALRMQEFVQEYIAPAPYQRMLICSHGRSMRILLCLLLQKPLSAMEEFPHYNLCLYKIHWTPEKTEIVLHNSTDHLQTLL